MPRAADTVPRAADTAPLADTVLPSTDTASLPADVRAALAAAWQEEARMEHASVAAFAKLSLDLLAFGAPPDLITRAHEAAMEEVTHAQLTFSLASAYAGTPIGPAPLRQAASAGHDPMTIARLVEETILDGCAGETAAAVEASCAADTSTDPGIARSLRGIAADESRHAELAFRIVAWALASAPEEAAPAVRRALTHLRAELARAPARLEVAAGKGPLADHGVLGTTERARIRRDVLREVVIPALEQTAHLERARRREIGVEPEAGV
ncbi:MAG: ferritin-like domain-containing protein [Polyangiaceae bacterium]